METPWNFLQNTLWNYHGNIVFHGNSIEYFTCNPMKFPWKNPCFVPWNSMGYKPGPLFCRIAVLCTLGAYLRTYVSTYLLTYLNMQCCMFRKATSLEQVPHINQRRRVNQQWSSAVDCNWKQGTCFVWRSIVMSASVCLSLCVCLSIREHISRTTRVIFIKCFVHVAYC